MNTINCCGKLLDLTQPAIMGIINTTPDSFYEKSRHLNPKSAINEAEKMINAGAVILDIGGMSTRPGSSTISIDEEIRRVVPVINAIRSTFESIIISIDTFRMEVAKAAVDNGADLINDISAGDLDPSIIEFAGSQSLPYIMMHMKGVPVDMQDDPIYDDVVQQVFNYLMNKINTCSSAGIRDIIIDPGFGFGKTAKHNFSLLKRLEVFKVLGRPILIGISRKSMIYKTLEVTADDSLYGTTAAHVIALQKGARILRVHDVRAAYDAIEIWKQVENAN